MQAENIRRLEVMLAELRAANDLRSAEGRHTSVKLAEHQIAIEKSPGRRRGLGLLEMRLISSGRPLGRRNRRSGS